MCIETYSKFSNHLKHPPTRICLSCSFHEVLVWRWYGPPLLSHLHRDTSVRPKEIFCRNTKTEKSSWKIPKCGRNRNFCRKCQFRSAKTFITAEWQKPTNNAENVLAEKSPKFRLNISVVCPFGCTLRDTDDICDAYQSSFGLDYFS